MAVQKAPLHGIPCRGAFKKQKLFKQERTDIDQISRISDTGRFPGRMHGELGQTDISGGNGDPHGGQIAQRGSSGHIGAVGK